MYVDLAYVPHNGDSKYVGPEYFQLVHARYVQLCKLRYPC